MQYANTLLMDRVLFGSDYPLITPGRWLKELTELRRVAKHPVRDRNSTDALPETLA